MSGVAGGSNKKSRGRTVATKTLIINEYKRRLKDNIRSLNDNFHFTIAATKINTDDAAHKHQSGRMTEFYSTKNEMAVRAALIARACDELLKLTNDLKEFLILHDFNFLTDAIKSAEDQCEQKMKVQVDKHNHMRYDVTNLIADMDKEYVENYSFRH